MNCNLKRAVACFLVIALLASFCLACAKKEEEGKVTIVIGEITDLTGAGAPAVIPSHYVLADLIKYYNEEGWIPGAKLKVVTYDTHTDPARDVPGYDWCKERGAKVIHAILPTTSEVLKPYAERERIPVAGMSYTPIAVEPPGWVFIFGWNFFYAPQRLLKWISEEHWDYSQGVPKIGFFGWRYSMAETVEKALREYCEAHSDRFEWVGGYMPPVGSMTFYGEIEQLKDCDYIYAKDYPGGIFIRDFRARGYTATFITDIGYYDFFVDVAGWEAVDGTLTVSAGSWWNEPCAAVDLAKKVVSTYRAGQTPEDIGASYESSFLLLYGFLEILRETVEEVGAESFDGQAFYDTAVKLKWSMEGLPECGFTETKRYSVSYVAVHEWRAEAEDMVRISDWLHSEDLGLG